MHTVWRVHPADPERARSLAGALGLHPMAAQLLLNRGLGDPAKASAFLRPTLDSLGDPSKLPDMDRAIARLRQAIARRESILIFGDSDVDGLTASAILYEALRDLGAAVRVRHSNRIADGYGLPAAAVRQLTRSAMKLLVLVDCGTNQADEVESLRAHGIDTIIVDHHLPLERWAAPYAFVNPKRGQGPGQELCSAGLAFKVAQGLLGTSGRSRLSAYLDLAALGTLADYSPLTGDSRIIVTEGLPRIVRSLRPGLRRLCQATRTSNPEPESILRGLVPRLNASGRLGDPSSVWKLLVSGEGEPLDEWLADAAAAHTTTRGLHRRIVAEAEAQVSRLHFRDQYVVVVSGQDWHQGLMGPLASRLAQRYGRPAIALALGERQGIGSGRSIPLYNLLEALQACQDLLLRFGGHAQACGLTVDRSHLEPFRAQVNQHAKLALGPEGLLRTRQIDLDVSLSELEAGWIEQAQGFAPFGQENPRPAVIIRRVLVESVSPRTTVLSDGTRRVAVRGRKLDGIRGWCDVVASPALDEDELVLTVSDVRGAGEPSALARTSSSSCRPGRA